MISRSSGFTLIEVLVSIIILSVVSVGLFQISSNSQHNFLFLKKKSAFDRLSSLVFMHRNRNWHNSQKSLYDFIASEYAISDDDFRRYLKNYKVHYLHEEFSSYTPLGEEIQESNASVPFKLLIDKITVTHEKESSYTYQIGVDIGQ